MIKLTSIGLLLPEVGVLFPILLAKYNSNPGHCIQNEYKMTKGGDKYADWLRNSGPEE